MEIFFAPADASHKNREKQKARELRQSVWWRQVIGKGVCYHCGQKFSAQDLTMDHLIPIVRGGKSTKKNVVPSCKSCNTKKSYLTTADLALKELAAKTSGN